jgi:hypothetical protein
MDSNLTGELVDNQTRDRERIAELETQLAAEVEDKAHALQAYYLSVERARRAEKTLAAEKAAHEEETALLRAALKEAKAARVKAEAELAAERGRLDWAEHRLDDLSVYRDSAGTRVDLDFCSKRSGCSVSVTATSIRAAIDEAREKEKG